MSSSTSANRDGSRWNSSLRSEGVAADEEKGKGDETPTAVGVSVLGKLAVAVLIVALIAAAAIGVAFWAARA